MKRQPAFYTLKVWLWSAVASPVIAGMIQFYLNHGTLEDKGYAIIIYPVIVAFEILLTFLLWVLFWALTAICSNLVKNDVAFRCAASIIGLSIAGGLCWFIGSDQSFSLGDIFMGTALCNCLCIFAGCWYFDIGEDLPPNYYPTPNYRLL